MTRQTLISRLSLALSIIFDPQALTKNNLAPRTSMMLANRREKINWAKNALNQR